MLNMSQWLWIWGGLRASWLGNVSLGDVEDAALISSVWIKGGEQGRNVEMEQQTVCAALSLTEACQSENVGEKQSLLTPSGTHFRHPLSNTSSSYFPVTAFLFFLTSPPACFIRQQQTCCQWWVPFFVFLFDLEVKAFSFVLSLLKHWMSCRRGVAKMCHRACQGQPAEHHLKLYWALSFFFFFLICLCHLAL